ncbi:MAG: Crp/Fnr family transcriptional regulator [Alphaproteobacteria bacterium]|nr:Crp/Fnr family transcriptional regulator [Alphaproteobacteria bacterium]
MDKAQRDQLALCLEKHELFGLFSIEERARLLARAQTVNFDDGALICQRGDSGDYCLLVLEGDVRISVSTSDGKSITVTRLGCGALVGEMALLDGRPRSADVTAEGKNLFLRIERKDFLALLESNGAASQALVALLCLRLRRTNALLEMVALQNLPARLARYLLGLSQSRGIAAATGVKVNMGLTQSALAEHLAASREGINKTLNLWQERGLVALLNGNMLVLQDIESLQAIAGIADDEAFIV